MVKLKSHVHSFGFNAVHIVFVTKYRHPVINEAIKTITSREIRKEFAQQLKPYYWKPVLWKRGFGYTSAGGAPLTVLKQYIENQGYDS